MDFSPREAARFLLRPGDVLICEGGEVGRAAIWTGQLSECYYQKALHRVRVSPAILSEFLRYLLEHYARARAFERFTSGSTIAHLPQEDLRNLPIPVAPIAEQVRIVAAIDQQLSRLEAALAALARVIGQLTGVQSGRADQLRSAILAVAFSGRLVAQDPTDEPASILIKRIAAESMSSNDQGRLRDRQPRAGRTSTV
jgi:type I restriction enzyme S subunit